jgi:hypothetical protein
VIVLPASWRRELRIAKYAASKEILVAAQELSRDVGPDGIGSPIHAAAILLAIVIAICLAVVNVLVSPDVTAAPGSSLVPASAVVALNPPVKAGNLPASHSAGQGSEWTDNSRECGPAMATDSNCMCD